MACPQIDQSGNPRPETGSEPLPSLHQHCSDSSAIKTGSPSDEYLTEKQELGESLAKLQLKPDNTDGSTRTQRPAFGRCAVCLKEDVHWSDKCPYLKYVPHGTTIGPRYEIVCTMCGKIGGHPGRDNWEGRAEEKYCFNCLEDGLHWDKDCPISPYDDTDSQSCKPWLVRVAGVGGCVAQCKGPMFNFSF